VLRPRRRCDLGNLTVGHRRKSGEDVLEIGMGIDSPAAAARDDRVDHRTPPAGIFVSDEEPVLFAHGGRSDRVFDKVIIAYYC
jgi:hypothetical protein